jgi:hypothetical protein
MLVEQFYATVGAVLVGNLLTLLLGYVIWRSRQLEKQGKDASELPFWVLLLALIPAGAIVLAGFLLV